MENLDLETSESKPIRRFVSYEEFLKAFWPDSAENPSTDEEEENGDFGTNLAIDSLQRHGDILKFGA